MIIVNVVKWYMCLLCNQEWKAMCVLLCVWRCGVETDGHMERKECILCVAKCIWMCVHAKERGRERGGMGENDCTFGDPFIRHMTYHSLIFIHAPNKIKANTRTTTTYSNSVNIVFVQLTSRTFNAEAIGPLPLHKRRMWLHYLCVAVCVRVSQRI